MALQIGESVGHYQIVEELGVGGNGRVLKVQHLITRRREAMKILSSGRPTSQEYAHRVLREIRLQASLDHPNIAAVLNAFWLEDDLVMIMELIDGVSLQKILASRRLNLDQSLVVIRQVLLALAHAHSHGVVHRDVSTANIIVSEDGRVKLTDFGLAKNVTDASVTEAGGMMGTPYYMSPELVRGTTNIDHRTDIYSAGVVLYELLTGVRPFQAESAFLLMQAHVQFRPQAPIERNPAIPTFINEAILRAMAKKPQDRFQNIDEFLAALEGPAVAPVEAEPVIAQPAMHSHSFAEPLPPEDLIDDKPRKKAPAPVVAGKNQMRSTMLAAAIGVGIVAAVMTPLMWRTGVEARPIVSKPLPPAVEELDLTKQNNNGLQAGPKQLPISPQGDAGLGTRRATPKRQPAAPRVVEPPKITVWGEARTPSSAAAVPPPPVAAKSETAIQKPEPRRIEDPPVLAPAPAPKAAIEPTVPQPEGSIKRPGLFRRLAKGVKALNPIRRDNEPQQPTPLKP